MVQLQGRLVDINSPIVMGIVNVTPDSFAVHCDRMDESGVLTECERLVSEGADWLDVGACSTRPRADVVSEEEEKTRLDMALTCIRREYPHQVLSVDTFRASIAEYVVKQYGVDIINDVSGLADEKMLGVLARMCVPYTLTHSGAPGPQMLSFLVSTLDRLHEAGMRDVMVDPGLGFGKTLEQNYACLRQLPLFKQLNCPLLVGISRKSMIYKALECTPDQALNGTTAAHMLALMGGTDILRVHDVKETREAIEIWKHYCH